MTTRDFGRLERINIRDVWGHEAHDFTPWLLENADRLGEALQIELELRAAEHPVGDFSLDLIGRDLTNDCELIVENQLGATDHGHLGQLMTYAAGTKAQTIVWVAPEFREEHREALRWLNDIAGDQARFFGVEVSVVRIGDSLPAPLFELRAEPNEWGTIVSRETHAPTEAQLNYRSFWEALIPEIQQRYPAWRGRSRAGKSHYLILKSPFPHTHFAIVFSSSDRMRSELYIDSGDSETTTQIFDRFLDARDAIEQVFQGSLDWEHLPNKRGRRISSYREGQPRDAAAYPEFVDWALVTQARMREALASVNIDFSDLA